MSHIKISVIIPIYNSAKFLNNCLSSVCSQTLQDIEIILINDCSEDESPKIIRRYLNSDKRIQVIHNKRHRGASVSRNIGISVSKGEYLSFLDSDDTFNVNYLELMYAHSKRKHADIVFTKYNIIDDHDNIISQNNGFLGIPDNNNINYALHNNINLFTITTPAPWNKIYRRQFIQNNKLFFQNTRIANDIYFFKSSFYFAKSIFSLNVSLINCRKIWDNNNFYMRYLFYNDIFKANNKVYKFLLTNNAQKNTVEKFFISACSNYYGELKKFPKGQYFKKFYFITKVIKFFPLCYTLTVLKFFLKKLLFKHKVYIKKNFFYKTIYLFKYLFARFGITTSSLQVNIIQINRKLKNIDFFYYKFQSTQQIPVIISLTSFPQRINEVKYALFSLINQNIRPLKIILWLAESQFSDKDLVYKKFNIFYKFGIEVKFTSNIGSYKKIIPTLKLYPNNIIITADDDIYYPIDWLEQLYTSYLEHKGEKVAICHRMHKIVFKNGKIAPYNQWEQLSPNIIPSPLNFATSGGGILFPPHCFYRDVTLEQYFIKLAKYGDDIWLWAMLILNNWNYISVSQEKFKITSINLIRDKNIFNNLFTLSNKNINENKNDEQLTNILNVYTKILPLLENAIK